MLLIIAWHSLCCNRISPDEALELRAVAARMEAQRVKDFAALEMKVKLERATGSTGQENVSDEIKADEKEATSVFTSDESKDIIMSAKSIGGSSLDRGKGGGKVRVDEMVHLSTPKTVII